MSSNTVRPHTTSPASCLTRTRTRTRTLTLTALLDLNPNPARLSQIPSPKFCSPGPHLLSSPLSTSSSVPRLTLEVGNRARVDCYPCLLVDLSSDRIFEGLAGFHKPRNYIGSEFGHKVSQISHLGYIRSSIPQATHT